MLTGQQKQGLVLFGKNGLLASVSTTIGFLVAIVGGSIFLKAQGQNMLITPIVRDTIKNEVDAKVEKAEKSCQQALANHIQNANEERQEIKKKIDKQEDMNQKIFDKLMTIAEDVAEMKGRIK